MASGAGGAGSTSEAFEYEPRHVYYWAHGRGEGEWLAWADAPTEALGGDSGASAVPAWRRRRLVAYPALASHELYPYVGTYYRCASLIWT